jgi:two-component system OmpR family response regulator
VTHAADGQSALDMFEEGQPAVDLIILDLMLPGMSGYSVCETIREAGRQVPVLMLSARTLAEDRTRGFDVGADQYLTKPFELDELLSRVNRLLHVRRTQSLARRSSSFRFGNVTVNFDKLQVTVGEQPHQLTALEMKLLEYFVKNEGRVIARKELLEKVWERSGRLATRAPDQFIRRLRKIIEPNPSEPMYLSTIRDAGYRFSSTTD